MAKAGSGTLVLGGGNTYSAGTALDQGVLRFASGTLPHAAASIHFDGGTLQWAAGNTQDVSAGIAPIAGGETAILDTNGNNVNVNTALSGGGGLAKLGGGILLLLRANSYSGETTISGGTLQLGNGVAGNDGSIVGNIIDNAALLYNLVGNQTYGGAISGNGSLSKLGEGTLVLTGSNTYAGGTAIDAGTLTMNNGSALLDGTSLTVAAGGTFVFDPSIAGSPVIASAASQINPVPEPGTLVLFGIAVFGAVVYLLQRRRAVGLFRASRVCA